MRLDKTAARREKEELLRKAGWSKLHNEDYWTHPKTVVDKSKQDHTAYGLSLDEAYKAEINLAYNGKFVRIKNG